MRLREIARRWRTSVRRILGWSIVGVLVVVAGVALLLPPAAGANPPLPQARAAGPAHALPPLSAEGASVRFMGPRRDQGIDDSGIATTRCGAAGSGEKLDINLATAEELDRLPGIGPAKAAQILAWRTRHGRFRRLKDLRRVKGFGRKTVLKLAPFVTVGRDLPRKASGGGR